MLSKLLNSLKAVQFAPGFQLVCAVAHAELNIVDAAVLGSFLLL